MSKSAVTCKEDFEIYFKMTPMSCNLNFFANCMIDTSILCNFGVGKKKLETTKSVTLVKLQLFESRHTWYWLIALLAPLLFAIYIQSCLNVWIWKWGKWKWCTWKQWKWKWRQNLLWCNFLFVRGKFRHCPGPGHIHFRYRPHQYPPKRIKSKYLALFPPNKNCWFSSKYLFTWPGLGLFRQLSSWHALQD